MDTRDPWLLRRSLPHAVAAAVSRLGSSLLAPTTPVRSLLAVGTPTHEPWHLVAHLDDAREWLGLDAPRPTLIRHAVPANAAPHLSIGLERLSSAGRGDTVLVLAPSSGDDGIDDTEGLLVSDTTLERLADTKRRGGTVLAITSTERPSDLASVSHDIAWIPSPHWEPATHLLATGEGFLVRPTSRRGLARILAARS